MNRHLQELAAALGTRDVARVLIRLVERGSAQGIAVWRVGGAHHDLLVPLGDAGVPQAALLHIGPRARTSALWRCVESGVPERIEPVPEALGDPEGSWEAHPLVGPEGAVGVVLAGAPDDPARALIRHAGRAFARAVATDDARLRASLFEPLAALVSDGVIVATPDGQVLAYNDALERSTGWTPADVRQHGWTNLAYPDPEVRAGIQRGIAALTLGRTSEGVVRTIARKDGTAVRMGIWSRLVSDPAGGAPAMLGVLRDVTSAEAARKRELRDESLARMGRLAGGIAHEFNNLLCAMMGHAELIALTPDLPPDVAARAETIVQGAQRGAALAGQLLAFSGTSNTRTQPADLGRIAEETLELWRPRLGGGVAVELARGPVPPVEADAGQLAQVLVNLFANAGEAMAAGGTLTVEVDRASAPASPRFRAPDAPPPGTPMGRVRIRDTGPGFSADALAHLFEPFWSGKDGGHGIGLPAARGIVAAHAGILDVQPGPGAVVDLYVPLSDRPELVLEALVQDLGARSERVWVVDDQPAVLEFTRVSLEAHGYRVHAFSGVREALDALGTAGRPDVLVLDVVMPDGGGPAVRAGLRAQGIDVPVVWISGHAPDALELPEPAAFLQKPFAGRDLAAVLRGLLDTDSPLPKPV